jgi:ADP-ribosylglycohydrolase
MKRSLEGLSLGDAFGERFFVRDDVFATSIKMRRIPANPPWRWTDDTAMALSLVETLEQHKTVNSDDFAKRLGERYAKEPHRGYGAGAHEVLGQLSRGAPWKQSAQALFEGTGSKGNGAAMRVAPLGAFFVEEPLSTVVEEAFRSASVTHAHADGQAGAVAVAVAASLIARNEELGIIWRHILARTPPGATRDGLNAASRLGFDQPSTHAAQELGCGAKVLSEDTVPFSIWCALKHLNDYSEALWATVAAGGDRDTTCAIVGGLVGIHQSLPPDWLSAREPI